MTANDIVLTSVKDVGESFACKAPRTKEHLAVYCATVFDNRVPYPAHCEDHQSILDALWSAYAELDDFSIWYAMRGTGKTWTVSLLSWLESVFKPNCGTTVLGGSLEQSQKAVAYLDLLWNFPGVPSEMLVNGAVAGRGFKLTNGSWVTALAASTKSVRGPHPQKLRLDEVDEMDEKIYNAALGQPKSNYGIRDNVVISSTLHNAFGLMTEIIDNRETIDATLYRWCYKDMLEPYGFWPFDELLRKRKQLTRAMWDSEYALKRPKIGDSIWEWQTIENAYRRGIKQKFDRDIHINEAGIDWGHTCTVLNIVQDTKEKFKVPESYSWEYAELVDKCQDIAEICLDKNINILYCDSNPKDSNITLSKIFKRKKVQTQIIPVAFNKWKTIGIDVIRYLLERDMIDITDKTLQDKMKKYHYKNVDLETIDKVDDHYPDSLIAWGSSRWKMLDIQVKNNRKKAI